MVYYLTVCVLVICQTAWMHKCSFTVVAINGWRVLSCFSVEKDAFLRSTNQRWNWEAKNSPKLRDVIIFLSVSCSMPYWKGVFLYTFNAEFYVMSFHSKNSNVIKKRCFFQNNITTRCWARTTRKRGWMP